MKNFFVVLAALAISAGFAAKADDQCTGPQNCPNQTDCPQKACPQQPCDMKACEKACPFEGLNLTDAQKEQLKELREKAAKARKQAMQQAKQAKSKAQQAKSQAKSEDKRNRLAEIKKILTPEQYIQFLENHFVNGGDNKRFDRQMPKHARGEHNARMQRHGTDGDRMDKPVPASEIQPAEKVEKVKE